MVIRDLYADLFILFCSAVQTIGDLTRASTWEKTNRADWESWIKIIYILRTYKERSILDEGGARNRQGECFCCGQVEARVESRRRRTTTSSRFSEQDCGADTELDIYFICESESTIIARRIVVIKDKG